MSVSCGERPIGWRRILSNHNPLYLLSAWLVLYGVSQAFRGDVGLRWVPLMTQLLCGYILALVLTGWLVVRVARVWEDARMVLLVVLLMFTALSTSYDDLCLKDPASGLRQLAIGFVFSCGISELILFSLGIKLPLRYRVPFYLQLAVLFAFPAWLGKLSVDGQDPAMCLGVLSFPLAAAAALLTLLPAAARSPARESDNGTPWPWPYYPWSIFVFMSIACGIRAWMLSLSFTPAAGVQPAFLPYFLCPILIAMLVLVLEMGLQQESKRAQLMAMLAMLVVICMAFPGERLYSAQRLSLGLLEGYLAGPPLLVCITVALIAAYAALRRASGGELVAVVSFTFMAYLDRDTRSFFDLRSPNLLLIVLVAVWQLAYGLWSRATLRLAYGGLILLFVSGWHLDGASPFALDKTSAAQLGIIWCALLPLYCRDELANWLRMAGPFWIVLVASGVAVISWQPTNNWLPGATTIALSLLAVAYWAAFRSRWYLAAAAWAAVLSIVVWTSFALGTLQDIQLRRGLTWYAIGLYLLAVALIVSLSKACYVRRTWAWLQGSPVQSPD